MKNRPDLQNLIQKFKTLQLDQNRIQSRQAEIINLLDAAYTGSTEDNRQATRAQNTRPSTAPPAAASQRTNSSGRKDKNRSAIKIRDKVQILTFPGLLRKDKFGIITGFTAKSVQIRTGSPPELILRADSNLLRVIDI